MSGNLEENDISGWCKRAGAWVVAGVVFGAWQWYENQRDNTTNVDMKEFQEHNSRIRKRAPVASTEDKTSD